MTWFRNHYRCDRCGGRWTDEWSATCDDDCPHCGARHMSPVTSEDLTEILEERSDGQIAVLRSPDDAEHTADYVEVAILPDREAAEALLRGRGVPLPGRPRRRRPATHRQAIALEIAIARLRDARDQLKHAACPKALRRVRSALKSAEGARRHMAQDLPGSTP
jgi:predicted  nucleic acid-binding Zn-ribbon protein